MKHAEFVPISYDTIEREPKLSYNSNNRKEKEEEHKLNLEQYEERKKRYYENEPIKFEKRKEQLLEELNNMTKENLLKNIVHFNCLIENDIKRDFSAYATHNLFMYNYHTDTRNWLTQLYLFDKKTNDTDQSHDLLGIDQTDDLLDAEIHIAS